MADLLSFHVIVHARPATAPAGPALESAGQSFPTLALSPTELNVPLGVSFEEAGAALSALPRMFFEPDGSFVWRGEGDAHEYGDWQVDGVLYDRHGRLLYVELKGTCPAERLDCVLTCLSWPAAPLVFQLARQAVFLDDAVFRLFSAGSANR